MSSFGTRVAGAYYRDGHRMLSARRVIVYMGGHAMRIHRECIVLVHDFRKVVWYSGAWCTWRVHLT